MKLYKKLKWFTRLILESTLDVLSYARSVPGPSASVGDCEAIHLESDIIRRYHVLEKGLCMPDFKARSSTAFLTQLVALIERAKDHPVINSSVHLKAARDVVSAYYRKHEILGVDVGDLIPEEHRYYTSGCNESFGGLQEAQNGIESLREPTNLLFRTRRSVRNFDRSRIPERRLILESISLAKETPSVCNRQAWRVYCFLGDEVQEVISHQSGNRGFGHTIPGLLVITVDMRYFVGPTERYQPWIDGGMFSMSLLLALHSRGLSSVALNWSVLNRDEQALRKQHKIPNHDRIIMMIGFGYSDNRVMVPRSIRNADEEFVRYITDVD